MSKQLGSEEVAAGALGYVIPIKTAFSPEGDLLTYLFPDSTGQRQLFSIKTSELSGGSANPTPLFESTDGSAGKISLEEQLRRERMRLFTAGISNYEWSSTGESNHHRVLVPVGDKLFVYTDDGKEKNYEAVYESALGSAIDPHLSPDGSNVAFVVKNDLYVTSAKAGSNPVRLTCQGEQPGISCAVADYVAQEEMSRYEGFWWSPDSQQILYTINDESFIPEYQILHQGKSSPEHHETHRYPFAGKQNPLVRLQVLRLPTDPSQEKPHVVDLPVIDDNDERFASVTPAPGHTKEYYIARAGWWKDGSAMVQVSNREQTYLQLLRIDPVTGARMVLLEEKTDVWINLHDLLYPLPLEYRHPTDATYAAGDFYFLWGSERSGYMQLYLYKYKAVTGTAEALFDGACLGRSGEGWVVESIADVDVHNGFVYFSGNYSNPTERHLWRANLHTNEGGVQRMTTHSNGWHDTTVAGARGYFADVYSNTEGPITFVVHAFDPVTGLIQQTYPIFDANVDDARVRAKRSVVDALRPPQIHILRSGDPSPQVDLYCAVYMPPGYNLADYEQQQALSGTPHTLPRFPAIMSVYGGPHVMRVQNQWLLTADLRAQRMAQQGIVVIKCDNRGSYRRGLAFEGAIKHDMGHVEVLDQVAAVEYFTRLGLVDPRRVGMFGWSYGGYMSAMSLCRAPSVFTCAVAGAPVTSWDGYDTHYTERYMGHPDVNIDGYRRSSVMEHVSHLTGHLMLVHGLIDENVHFRHTARLINELIAARKRYELILFPCERHAPHKMQDKVYLEDLMTEFFLKHLRPTPLAELATTPTTTSAAAAAGAGAVVDGGANEALGSGALGASATLASKGGRAAL